MTQTAPLQPVVYYVSTAEAGQPCVVIQTQANSEPQQLYLGTAHKVLGILQMIVGCLCFSMEIVGVCFGPTRLMNFTGFYTGVIFFTAGLLGYLAYRKNNHCLLVACMVMSIIAALTTVVGVTFSFSEMLVIGFGRRLESERIVQHAKQFTIIAACCFELIVSIVQASYTCASCCQCCWPMSKRAATSRAAPAVIVQPQSHLDSQQPNAIAVQQSNTAGEVGPPSMKASLPPGAPGDYFPASDLFGACASGPPPYSE